MTYHKQKLDKQLGVSKMYSVEHQLARKCKTSC